MPTLPDADRSPAPMRDVRTQILVWGVVAAVASLRTWLGGRDEAVPITLVGALALEAPAWLLWVVVAPAVLAVSERAAVRGRSYGLVRHAAVLTATLLASAGLGVLALGAFPDRPPHPRLFGAFLGMLSLRSVPVVAVYAMLAALGVAGLRETELARRGAEASEMRGRLAEAELEALRARINPHFLFNALNACSALIDENPADARRLLARLGHVLRSAYDREARDRIPLSEELEVVRAYLDVEEARFGERMRVSFDIEDAVRDAEVPPLLIQPLAENAARHGVAPVTRPCAIRIGAWAEEDELVVEVVDDGAGIEPGYREGGGLSITRERLERRYGPQGSLDVGPGTGGGTIARLRLPLVPPTLRVIG